MVELAERLIGKGFELRIYDANVALSRLMGANRAYMEEHLPHLGDVLTGDSTRCSSTAKSSLSDVAIRPSQRRLRRWPTVSGHRPYPPSQCREIGSVPAPGIAW